MLLIFIISAALNVAFPGLLALGQWRKRRRFVEGQDGEQAISVVVAARDEADRLPGLLQSLKEQDFQGKWELVLVLDRCRDDSSEVAKRLAAANARLRIIEIDVLPEGWTGKKWALEKGIEAAKYERIALTDADCLPESGWLSGVSEELDQGNELVLGLGLYRAEGGLLNAFVRFETHLTAMQYLGLAGWGMPYMGVGRNLAYTRDFFRKAGGLGPIARRLSGDDDLLVNRHADPMLTGTMSKAGTSTVSTAPSSWKAWWRQKIRHLSAGTGYRPATTFILSALHGLQVIFYLSLVGVLCSERPPELVWAIFAGRTVLAAIFWNAGTGFRMQIGLVLLFPLLDLLYLLYNLIMVPASLFLTPKWR